MCPSSTGRRPISAALFVRLFGAPFVAPFVALFALVALMFLPAACAKPEPPRITPKAVKVLALSTTGVEVELTLAVENPNGIDIDARSVDATMTLDRTLEIGKTSIPRGVHLPAHATVDLRTPVSLPWKNLAALAPYALRETVPFTVQGEVQFGSPVSIGVPFTIQGTLTRDQLTKLTLSALPGLPLPSLPGQ